MQKSLVVAAVEIGCDGEAGIEGLDKADIGALVIAGKSLRIVFEVSTGIQGPYFGIEAIVDVADIFGLEPYGIAHGG